MADIKRKLATIRTIKSVEPIEGADSIVKLTFESMNWVCVTNKDSNPVPGQRRVYFEIDSVLPDLPIFEFMKPYRFRVKTIKLRGQVSQGLSIPLEEIFDSFKDEYFGAISDYANEGDDLTDLIGVVKYEIPEDVNIGGDTKGSFPGFITKTDEERAQNIDHIEDVLATQDLSTSVKVDGSSATFYLYEGEFGVCSRNLELKDTETNTLWKLARKYKLKERMEAFALGTPQATEELQNFALQGEVAGPGIQNNRAKLLEVGLYIFTAQDIDNTSRLDPEELNRLIDLLNQYEPDAPKIMKVPFLGVYPAGTFKTIKDLEDFSKGPTALDGTSDKNVQREGVVFRSVDGNISFKYINPQYLLKHDL